MWLLATGLFCLPALLEVAFSGTDHALLPYDVLCLALFVAQVPALRNRQLLREPITVLLLALLALTVVSALSHDTVRGITPCLRLVETVAVVTAMRRAAGHQQLTLPLAAFTASAILQTLVAVAEAVSREQLTIFRLDDRTDLLPFGDQVGVDGTFIHPYLLAGMSILCLAALVATSDSWRTDAAALVVAVPLGLTYSRMSVLALLLIGVVAVGWRFSPPTLRWQTVAAAAVGSAVPALVTSSGWLLRVHESGIGGDGSGAGLDAASSGRVTFIRQSWELITGNPLLGVGPGRYLQALGALHPHESFTFPVHNVPLLVTAECGVAAGLVMAALLVVSGWSAVRSGPRTTAVFVAYLPFTLLDWPYGQQQAVMVFGLWLALVASLGPAERASRRAQPDPPTPQPT